MRGQFDTTARIVSEGAALEVTGPVEWEDDERGATVRAWVTQGDVVASGTSDYTPASKDTWSATLAAHGGKLHPGFTPARANATVSLKDGQTEPYPWRDQVDLVD